MYGFTDAHSYVYETVLYNNGPVSGTVFVYEGQHLVEILCDDGLRTWYYGKSSPVVMAPFEILCSVDDGVVV